MDKSEINLHDITIIIPTYNRPKFLKRLLNYYHSKNTDALFLVLDSSNDVNKNQNMNYCTSLNENIDYLSFANNIDFGMKLYEGIKKVKTTYMVFCADDDLLFLNGVSQALGFLRNNPNHVCADGIYLNYMPIEKNLHLGIEYASPGINLHDEGARIFRLYQCYQSLFYGVYKTKDAKKIFSGLCQNETLHYQELFQATAALLLGKSHRLPVFYCARQLCESADVHRDKWNTFYWFADNAAELIEHYGNYRNSLWRFYKTYVTPQTYSQNEFFKLIDITHGMYFAIGSSPSYYYSHFEKRWVNDCFQEIIRGKTDISNQLKSRKHLFFENFLRHASNKILNFVDNLYSRKRLNSLNSEIEKSLNSSYQYILKSELQWLANIKDFRETCMQLGVYLQSTENLSQGVFQ